MSGDKGFKSSRMISHLHVTWSKVRRWMVFEGQYGMCLTPLLNGVSEWGDRQIFSAFLHGFELSIESQDQRL